ncbi:Pentatricopeptide repeat-containing protein [Zea mays]|uniref:Pentatricopeptide repeat-containing protein n=2 Tax=Zea mays TaxID=4577 RepID=A0A8J8XZH2_MAIZE|nr:Pentatricopeptide repeat-containing protein [Zea mays]PWZ31899.1 Pentatricopeptide repeat-containing protein [Zea mays]
MALSKPLLSRLLPLPLRLRPQARFLCLATPPLTPTPTQIDDQPPADAAAERRRRKRRLRVEPPLSRGPAPQRAPGAPRPASNPNAPKIPEPASVLSGKRLDLHRRILTLIRENDLDEAALLTRHSIYSNCRPTVFTCNAVLAALLRQARYADLLSLHRFVTQASVAPTVATYNLLLQAYCDCRRPDVALEHFRLLLKDDSPVLPSPTTYRILARSLAENGKLDQALELKDGMLERGLIAPDTQVYAFIMGGFVNAGDGDKAVSLFEEIKEKLGGESILDGVVYGNLMKGYFLKGMEKEAMDCYAEVLGEGSKVRFGAVSYNMVLDALGRNGRLDDALNLFDRMCMEHDPPRTITVNLGSFNVMVDAYCRAERFQDAIEVFGKMAEKKCAPDALSYNNLIDWLDDAIKVAKCILLDESVVFSDETKALLEEALDKEGRNGQMTKLYEDVEMEKAEAAARAAEEKARAEALAKEEEERKKAEAKAKEEAAARASRAAIEAVLGRKREAEKQEPVDGLNVEDAEVVESKSDTSDVSGEQNEGDEHKKQEPAEASSCS